MPISNHFLRSLSFVKIQRVDKGALSHQGGEMTVTYSLGMSISMLDYIFITDNKDTYCIAALLVIKPPLHSYMASPTQLPLCWLYPTFPLFHRKDAHLAQTSLVRHVPQVLDAGWRVRCQQATPQSIKIWGQGSKLNICPG